MSKQRDRDSQTKFSNQVSGFEQTLADLSESSNVLRMTLLNVQTQIERLGSQQNQLYTQFEKLDRFLPQLNGLQAQIEKIDRSLFPLNGISAQIEKVMPQLSATQSRFEALTSGQTLELKELEHTTVKTLQGQIEKVSQNFAAAKELRERENHTLRGEIDALKQTFETNFETLESKIQNIHPIFSDLQNHISVLQTALSLEQERIRQDILDMKNSMRELEEEKLSQLAVKPDVGEIIVKLEQMQIIEKENIALLSQHVSQIPNSHQLAQIYYAISHKASSGLVVFLWLLSLATFFLGMIFQPWINQIIDTYWSIFITS